MPHHRRLSSPPLVFKRFGPLSGILLMHVVFFYTLNSGLAFKQPAPAVPKEVVVSFITPERPAEPPKPQAQPTPPKPVPVVKKAAPPPPAPVPVVNKTPSEKAVTTPATPPAPPAPPAPANPAPAAPAAPPAPPAPPATPKTVTSDRVEYIQPPRPDYPAASRRLGEEGKAVLRVLINEKGHAERAEIQKSTGSSRLDEAARQAALRIVIKPYIEDGKPIPILATLPISFHLDN